MQDLSQRVCTSSPELLNAEATPGELAWCWGKDYDTLNSFWVPQLWEESDKVVAWAWVTLPYSVERPDGMIRSSGQARLVWQMLPDRVDLAEQMFDWFLEVSGHAEKAMILLDTDEPSRRVARQRGFEFDEEDAAEDEDWTQLNEGVLEGLPTSRLPDSFHFITAHDVTRDEAVRVHQAAWGSPVFTSGALKWLETVWPYQKDLHLFVRRTDGELVATAVIWFEPLGTHRDFRRKGLGRALQLFGMQKIKELGGTKMRVACLGGSAHLAAKNPYLDVGFSEISRDYPMIQCADA